MNSAKSAEMEAAKDRTIAKLKKYYSLKSSPTNLKRKFKGECKPKAIKRPTMEVSGLKKLITEMDVPDGEITVLQKLITEMDVPEIKTTVLSIHSTPRNESDEKSTSGEKGVDGKPAN